MSALVARATLAVALLVPMGTILGQAGYSSASLNQISSEQAIELAERFVRENGYTNAPDSVIKLQLDHESMEWTHDRAELLKLRRNTLQAKAIGVKAADGGWGVAFDYANSTGSCRVVIMHKDGSRIQIKHQDGIRPYWLGPSEQK